MKLETLVGFATLFSGRTDAWFNGDATKSVRKPISLEHFRKHLTGERSIGTYPVRDDASCRWGCIDIDDPRLKTLDPSSDEYQEIELENYKKATDVQSVWTNFGAKAWVERSRSKGFHVWTFADTWIPATHMRQAGLYVARIAGLPDGTEVNPKNDAPWKTTNGLVNTVRLPYYGRTKPGRMTVVDSGKDLVLQVFAHDAMASRTSSSVFQPLSTEYALRQTGKSLMERQGETLLDQESQASFTSRSKQDAAQILAGRRDIAVGERDNQFYTMAMLLKSQGEPEAMALRKIERVYYEQCRDTTDFPLDQALAKVRYVYR